MRYESCCNDAMQALFRALRRALPRGELLTDDASRVAAAYDNSRLQALAGCVAVPADTDEVAAVIRVCADAGVPVTARGLGSATTGASVPSEGGVVVSFRRMDRIGIPDPASRSLVVEAGAVNAAVQASAARAGCFWAPDQRRVLDRRRQPRVRGRRAACGEVRNVPRQRARIGGGDRYRHGVAHGHGDDERRRLLRHHAAARL